MNRIEVIMAILCTLWTLLPKNCLTHGPQFPRTHLWAGAPMLGLRHQHFRIAVMPAIQSEKLSCLPWNKTYERISTLLYGAIEPTIAYTLKWRVYIHASAALTIKCCCNLGVAKFALCFKDLQKFIKWLNPLVYYYT